MIDSYSAATNSKKAAASLRQFSAAAPLKSSFSSKKKTSISMAEGKNLATDADKENFCDVPSLEAPLDGAQQQKQNHLNSWSK